MLFSFVFIRRHPIEPSARGELEITVINLEYLKRRQLEATILGRGTSWMDMGSADGLLEANNFVATIQNRQGLYISCIEEIAYRKGFISSEELSKLIYPLRHTKYGMYISNMIHQSEV